MQHRETESIISLLNIGSYKGERLKSLPFILIMGSFFLPL
nr:MAG TPA: hypothetical protein [Bacteriophage sp.]